MKTIIEKIDQISKKSSVLLVAMACAALSACDTTANQEAKDGMTDADATSTQDTFKIRTDEGAGFSMDTSATTSQGTGAAQKDTISSTSEPRRELPKSEPASDAPNPAKKE